MQSPRKVPISTSRGKGYSINKPNNWTVHVTLAPAPTLTIPLDPGTIFVPYNAVLRRCGEGGCSPENAPPMRVVQRVNADLNKSEISFISSQQ